MCLWNYSIYLSRRSLVNMLFKGTLIFVVIVHCTYGIFDPLLGTNNLQNDPNIDITVVAPILFYGNGGHWDSNTNRLYFTDTILGKIYQYDPSTGVTTSVFVAFGLVAVVPVESRENFFLVTSQLSVLLVEWDGVSSEVSSSEELFNVVDQDRTNFRFDSGRADLNGVFYAGTIGKIGINLIGDETIDPGKAAFYQYRETGGTCEVRQIISDATAVVGLAWSPDNTIMYYCDGATKSIEAFDYDLATATMSNRRTFFNISENGFRDSAEHLVIPVSVVVDDQGNVWTSIFGAGQVLKISPEGQILQQILVPTILPSTLIWGGQNLSTLYLTSLTVLLKPLDIISNLRSGSLYAIEGTGSQGLPSYNGNYCPS